MELHRFAAKFYPTVEATVKKSLPPRPGNRLSFGAFSGEIRVLDSRRAVERIIPFSKTDRKL